ncbi:MAG: hypothetical protein J7474_01435 [Arthrobacter sp.]|nr:hypothetical protein [Arthrobacter sp.]
MGEINPSGLCVNHVHGEPFMAEPGTWLCGWCTDTLRTRCQNLATMWPVLEAALHPVAGPQDAGPRATRTAAPLPLNVDVVDLMQLAQDKARAIMSEIVEKREHTRVTDETTPGLLEWIGKWQLSWAAGWPDQSLVMGIWDDVAELWRLAKPYTDGATVVLVPVGWQCVEHAFVAGRMVRCEGKLLRAVHTEAGQDTDIRCSTDKSHRWPAIEWLRLLDRARVLGVKAARARESGRSRAAGEEVRVDDVVDGGPGDGADGLVAADSVEPGQPGQVESEGDTATAVGKGGRGGVVPPRQGQSAAGDPREGQTLVVS